jgi:hypothetical protein
LTLHSRYALISYRISAEVADLVKKSPHAEGAAFVVFTRVLQNPGDVSCGVSRAGGAGSRLRRGDAPCLPLALAVLECAPLRSCRRAR